MASDLEAGVSRRRRKNRLSGLLVLAAGLLLFAAAGAGLYLVLRPVTLRIAVGPPGSDDQKLVQALAQTFARDNSHVRLAPIASEGASESVALLKDGKADLAVARGDLELPADAESVAILRKNVVVLWAPAGLPAKGAKKPPARPEDKIDTVSVNHLIVARKALSDTAVGAFVRQLFAARPQIAREVPSASKIEKPDTDKDAALPAHAGAAAFIDGTERTFLERYSDYFWAAILVLSGFGSIGAWLRHYWKRNEREQYTLHRDSLLDLISKARQAETAEELATMQGEADGILREALDCYDDGAIEEGDLSVIGLALEQFHHAVADRRVSIGVSAADLPRRRAL